MSTIDERLKQLRECMKKNAVDFCLIPTSDPHMSEYLCDYYKLREYFTGFTGSAGTLLVSADCSYLWTDGRYYIQAADEISDSEICLMKDGLKETPSVADVIKKNAKTSCVVGVDFSCISKAYFDDLNVKLSGTSKIIDFSEQINSVVDNRPSLKFNPVKITPYKDVAALFTKRLAEIRKNIMAKCALDKYAFIIGDLGNTMWTFLLRGEDIEFVPVAYSYSVITDDEILLYINMDSLDLKARDFLADMKVNVKAYDSFAKDVAQIDKDVILVDKNCCNNRIYDVLPNKSKIVTVDENQIIRKDIKNDEELESIRKYHIDDAVSVIRFIKFVKETASKNGMDEYETGKYLDDLRLSNPNCSDLSFATICAYGANAAIVHYEASKDTAAKLKTKGFLLVDSGGQYPLCTTDITRTIALGELSKEEKTYYTAVLKGHLALLKSVFMNGTKGENLDILARQYLWNMGADYRHGTGHGIGCQLSVHEDGPCFRYKIRANRPSADLVPGMIVSDEPGYYAEGEFGIRIENAIEVINKEKTVWGDFYGFESLTLVPYEREAIDLDMLGDDEIEMIDDYHMRVYKTLSPLLDKEEQEWLKYATLPLKSARSLLDF